ncbi:MAG: cation diffusion facilitator family transporter [Kiritimatiellae bacterium]|nr:cation diffusion facilitator family transporter [Kiritimatiellia bacterium]MDD5520185.1 cation diffusion facilitator family transporter [Kiritimatiellia bacterium]
MADHPNTKRKTRVALLSVFSNTILVVLKLVVGLIIGSVSIISEAIHSGIDLLAAVIAFLAVKISGQPADSEHPFGHGKYENISGAIEAVLIFAAAIWILHESYNKLMNPKPLELAGMGVVIMLISAIANAFVSQMLFKVGNDTESIALTADAWHLRTDVYTCLGVMFGLGVIWLGKLFIPGLNLSWIDPVAAIFVAILITKAAWDLTADSVKDLLDTSLSTSEEELIRSHIKDISPPVRGFHGLKTRKAGGHRFVEFHLMFDPDLSIKESHSISDKLEALIQEHFPASNVTIHMEPCDDICDVECVSGCMAPDKQKKKEQA